MNASADYPRWMFHPGKEPVIVNDESEEAALGSGWSRKYSPPAEPERPADPAEPDEEGDEGQQPAEPEFDDPAEHPEGQKAPARKRAPVPRKR